MQYLWMAYKYLNTVGKLVFKQIYFLVFPKKPPISYSWEHSLKDLLWCKSSKIKIKNINFFSLWR